MKSRGRNAHIFLSQDIQNEAEQSPEAVANFLTVEEAINCVPGEPSRSFVFSVVEITEEWSCSPWSPLEGGQRARVCVEKVLLDPALQNVSSLLQRDPCSLFPPFSHVQRPSQYFAHHSSQNSRQEATGNPADVRIQNTVSIPTLNPPTLL